jgi:hypothetical protein
MSSTIFHRRHHSPDCTCALCRIQADAEALVASEPAVMVSMSAKDYHAIVACLRFVEKHHVVGIDPENLKNARINLQRAKLKAIEEEIDRTSEFLNVPAFLKRQTE